MQEGLPAGVERDIVTMEAPGVTRAGAGGYPLQGFYTLPAGAMPKVALIAAHYNVDFAEHYLSALMAQRGYGFLGWNTRFRGADHFFALDRARGGAEFLDVRRRRLEGTALHAPSRHVRHPERRGSPQRRASAA